MVAGENQGLFGFGWFSVRIGCLLCFDVEVFVQDFKQAVFGQFGSRDRPSDRCRR